MYSVNLWGRKVNVRRVYECDENQEPSNNQKEALNKFCEIINGKNSFEILIDSTKIMKFCYEIDKINVNKKETNIYKFVSPKEIYVKNNDKDRIVFLLLDFKYNIDNGIVIVFKNEKFVKICKENEL